MAVLCQFLQLSNVSHQVVLAQEFTGQLVVALVQSKTVIPNLSSNADTTMQVSILFAAVQFEFVRSDYLHC